jgi:hypothetical protein
MTVSGKRTWRLDFSSSAATAEPILQDKEGRIMRIEEVLAEYTPADWKRRLLRRSPHVKGAPGARVAQAWVFDQVDVSPEADARDGGADRLLAYLAMVSDSAAIEKLAATFALDGDGLREFKLALEIL